jgi:hypothetical protein
LPSPQEENAGDRSPQEENVGKSAVARTKLKLQLISWYGGTKLLFFYSFRFFILSTAST